MIAVTVGTGRFAEMARRAASRLTEMTGVPTRVLGEAELAASGLPNPVYLRFRVFDHVEEDDVLYFDADLVCLRPWDPLSMRDPAAIVAVRDRMIAPIFADAADRGLPAAEYFNAGFFIANRTRHLTWLRASEQYAFDHPRLPFLDQSALNAVRFRMGIPMRFLDRRYNWVYFGEGPLCYQMPVVMAHRLQPENNEVTLAFLGGRYTLPGDPEITIDESAMKELSGSRFCYVCPERGAAHVTLAEGGTLFPPGEPEGEGYWFVHRREGSRVLALASQTRVLDEFSLGGNGAWIAERCLRPPTAAEALALDTIVAQRWFLYDRVGHDQREIELLPGGRVGRGGGGCEENWTVGRSRCGAVCLYLGGRGRQTCRLEWDGAGGRWCGRWIVHERMPVTLTPIPGSRVAQSPLGRSRP